MTFPHSVSLWWMTSDDCGKQTSGGRELVPATTVCFLKGADCGGKPIDQNTSKATVQPLTAETL